MCQSADHHSLLLLRNSLCVCVYVSVYVHMETIGPYRPANMITPVNITFTPLAVPGKCAVCTQDFVNCYYFVALLNVPYTITLKGMIMMMSAVLQAAFPFT